jgi:hypothetical protein
VWKNIGVKIWSIRYPHFGASYPHCYPHTFWSFWGYVMVRISVDNKFHLKGNVCIYPQAVEKKMGVKKSCGEGVENGVKSLCITQKIVSICVDNSTLASWRNPQKLSPPVSTRYPLFIHILLHTIFNYNETDFFYFICSSTNNKNSVICVIS